MTPVEQRVSHSFFQRFRPFLKFFPCRRITCDIVLIHTVRTHLSPFVMISAQPYLGNIFKTDIFCNLFRIDMAMVIQNRHCFCKIMIQLLCCRSAQQKFFIHKWFHLLILLLIYYFPCFLVSPYIYKLYFFVNKKSITLLLAFCTIFFLIFCTFFH